VGIWIQSAATERRSTVIWSTGASFWPIAQLEEAKHCMGPIKTVSARETEAHVTLFSQTTFYFAKKKHLKTSLFTQTPLKFWENSFTHTSSPTKNASYFPIPQLYKKKPATHHLKKIYDTLHSPPTFSPHLRITLNYCIVTVLPTKKNQHLLSSK
jgi:hypothetical protein